ncbi:hypothetical protein [Polaribacter gangjinensis]|uniref:YtkA-like domain-containing protein n=1 Tax=Polaribacter gangjinensis TaxID=574710 RepID=A0A2S7WC92_9FLAO|nr:hypothetical protein [Polaribacter gangjinensis]PQJ75254.1 hypothetical protein BTO13_08340 [Polaribacter gangjinensis]
MKPYFKKIAILLVATIAFASCSKEVNETEMNELEGLTKIRELSNSTHTIELYSKKGELTVGFNEIKLRILDNTSDIFVKNAQVSWMPVMHMMMMNHSCPKSTVEKVADEGNLYEGYIMFQMAENASEYWDLTIDYTINGVDYSITSEIDVLATEKRTVNSFTGSDNERYLVTYIEPTEPKVAINDMKIGVWKMENMMSFPMVNDYTVKIDPRMPSMGNHSSPNNENATQSNPDDFYEGKLSLTMTGYWKINLQLAKADGTILKGEEITSTVESSSIFFEIEF